MFIEMMFAAAPIEPLFIRMLKGFSHYFTLWIAFPLVVAFGLYLTYRLRCIQVMKLRHGFASLIKKEVGTEGSISRFGAISTVLAGNFGTGNISGMAVALTTGGPGALVWMWVMAFFGSAIQYASCILSMKFRYKTKEGEYVSGPMYYLREGLGYKMLAALFAVCTLFGAITAGNFAQMHSMILPMKFLNLDPFYASLAIGTVVGIVILGGIKRISGLVTYLVPLKAALYLGTALVILFLYRDRIAEALFLMMHEAFDVSSLLGGMLGAGVWKALTTGFDRGLFATDAGTGLVPILQGGARSKDPVLDGLATLVAPVMVMLVCTTTGLVLLVTGVWQQGLQSTNMVTHAFAEGLGSPIGGVIVIVSLILFGFTTMLAWAYCGEKAFGFLFGAEKGRWFRWVFIAFIPVSNLIQLDLIWVLTDVAIVLMLVTNLIGVMRLSHLVIDSTREFNFSEKFPAA